MDNQISLILWLVCLVSCFLLPRLFVKWYVKRFDKDSATSMAMPVSPTLNTTQKLIGGAIFVFWAIVFGAHSVYEYHQKVESARLMIESAQYQRIVPKSAGEMFEACRDDPKCSPNMRELHARRSCKGKEVRGCSYLSDLYHARYMESAARTPRTKEILLEMIWALSDAQRVRKTLCRSGEASWCIKAGPTKRILHRLYLDLGKLAE